MSTRLITDSSEWSFPLLERFDRELGRLAHEVYGLDTYANQIEVISSEQMIDAYSSVGLPIYYQHWSFGKQFVATEQTYRRGQMGLAYEIVINSDPCIAYLMEENSLPMQALVIAHACYGHNSFFKGNYLFRTWTSADAIIDYLVFARKYIAQCEERYGHDEVELLLDSCHALMNHGVDRYKRPSPLSMAEEQRRQRERADYIQSQINDLWRTLPPTADHDASRLEERWPEEPQENILYFIEKNAPLLEPWQREIVRIVRRIGQYFYPQRQTQVMNEGWACVTGDTLIVTDQGLMPAQELVESRFSGRVEDGNRVVNWFSHPSKPRVRLRTRHGYKLHGGADHRILVKGQWVELQGLKIGDVVEIQRGQGVFASNEAVIDYDLKVRPRVAEVCRRHGVSTSTYSKWRCSVPTLSVAAATRVRLQECHDEWTAACAAPDLPWSLLGPEDLPRRPDTLGPDLAEVLGQVTGDGFVDDSRVNLTSQDPELLEFFEQTIFAEFGVKASRRPDRNHFNSTVYSAVLARLFKQTFQIATGWGASGRKHVPEIILKSPRSVVQAFLRGHFDTDGCIYERGRQVILVSKSRELLEVEQLLLLNLGIVCSLRPQKDGTHRLTITGEDVKRFAEQIGFRLPYKRQALQNALDSVKWFLVKDDLTTIEAIDYDEGPVYDFSVEESHTYKASCFINHNCFWHYSLMNHLYDDGLVSDGFMIEFLQSHTSVVFQPPFDAPYYSGINPYALGFAMMRDIRRICESPTDEDRYWFPDIAGGDWIKVLDFAMRNFKDESFIAQFLSPNLMREFRLFAITDDDLEEHLEVKAIHEDSGYRALRQALAEQYNLGTREPNIQVYNVDRRGDRSLTLRHFAHQRRPLGDSVEEMLRHIRRLWGFTVRLETVDDRGRVELIGEV
jgi:spore cortex formation protein SpoVR/YcgB (stage V sporulation)